VSPSGHDVRVRIERKGRKGKTVTVAGPFFLAAEDARDLAKALKSACGSGGTVKPSQGHGGNPCRTIEVQGDHVDRVIAALRLRGYPARRG
jgi:translation initiation factor 1